MRQSLTLELRIRNGIRMSVTKRFLVVDAWVIATASRKALDDNVWKAIEVLSRILHVCHKIILDPEDPRNDTILDEYQRQAKSEITKRWIITMQTRPKIAYRPRARLSLPILADPDDLKYFQVAVNSPHKIIISEDSDISNIANHPQVIGKGLTIWTLDDSLSNL